MPADTAQAPFPAAAEYGNQNKHGQRQEENLKIQQKQPPYIGEMGSAVRGKGEYPCGKLTLQTKAVVHHIRKSRFDFAACQTALAAKLQRADMQGEKRLHQQQRNADRAAQYRQRREGNCQNGQQFPHTVLLSLKETVMPDSTNNTCPGR